MILTCDASDFAVGASLIEGRRVIIRTDHKPLVYAFRQKLDKASPRQIRQLDFIAQFFTDIEHISGKQNFVADALSRVDSVSMPVIVSLEELEVQHLLFIAIALLNVYVPMFLNGYGDEYLMLFID